MLVVECKVSEPNGDSDQRGSRESLNSDVPSARDRRLLKFMSRDVVWNFSYLAKLVTACL